MSQFTSLFAGYRDKETREAMIDYVARFRSIERGVAEQQLMLLNHIGLAYVYRDMLEERGRRSTAIADYDPLAVGRS